ncbi:copper-binding protein [Pseudomonas sp. TNT2022 ID1044]|uniref:copper-binding protein n=1 Tax=Pseudomonas sp. TNT2022 ID1044 TaxID=2942636 RepID=UPI002361005A|nr:copper-binding protein [Pseudomonas sp. TNT2022 ID1044]MDD0997995.1 copper-binding protein [Pseudomonas sp. TNT2022 ID1044]
MKMTLVAIVTAVAALSFNAYAEEMNMGGDSMQSMNMNRTMKEVTGAKAEGSIKAIDQEKHMVTIAHGAIPAIQWPAMTMGFTATPEQVMGLHTGDKVAFTFSTVGSTAKIESIDKMK